MKRTVMMLLLLAGLLALPGAVGTRPPVAGADGTEPRVVTTNRSLSFEGSVDTCTETVHVFGRVHLLVEARVGGSSTPTDPCRIHTNLEQAVGVGMTSGRIYHAVGAESFSFPQAPPATYDFLGVYPILPGDPCRTTLPLSFSVAVNGDGTVGAADVVVGFTIPGPG